MQSQDIIILVLITLIVFIIIKPFFIKKKCVKYNKSGCNCNKVKTNLPNYINNNQEAEVKPHEESKITNEYQELVHDKPNQLQLIQEQLLKNNQPKQENVTNEEYKTILVNTNVVDNQNDNYLESEYYTYNNCESTEIIQNQEIQNQEIQNQEIQNQEIQNQEIQKQQEVHNNHIKFDNIYVENFNYSKEFFGNDEFVQNEKLYMKF